MTRRFQFSLRALLLLILAVGILLWAGRYAIATPAFSTMALVVLAFLAWVRTSLGK
ncbi:MAG TPA: hypothetical protein VHC22_33755 [Pirellulales bacterium]|nr:hypothetical protein [Pirellulales bacterium]